MCQQNPLILSHQQNKLVRMAGTYLPQLFELQTHPSIRRLHPVRIPARHNHRHHYAEKQRLSPEEIDNLLQRLKVPDFL